jgi:hypothetical protein
MELILIVRFTPAVNEELNDDELYSKDLSGQQERI